MHLWANNGNNFLQNPKPTSEIKLWSVPSEISLAKWNELCVCVYIKRNFDADSDKSVEKGCTGTQQLLSACSQADLAWPGLTALDTFA